MVAFTPKFHITLEFPLVSQINLTDASVAQCLASTTHAKDATHEGCPQVRSHPGLFHISSPPIAANLLADCLTTHFTVLMGNSRCQVTARSPLALAAACQKECDCNGRLSLLLSFICRAVKDFVRSVQTCHAFAGIFIREKNLSRSVIRWNSLPLLQTKLLTGG